ncbi:MAG: histidine kinase [Candidatus Bathyarchaeota archaeon]|nr:histidine kinase [Candidatus Bathyarchaeota archaeon]
MQKRIKNYFDFDLMLLLAGFYGIFEIIYFIKTYFRYYIYGIKDTWFNIILGDYLLDYFIVVGFMVLIAMTTKKFIKRNVPWKKIFFIHLSLSLLIGVLIRIISDIYTVLYYNVETYSLKRSIFRFINVLDLNFLIYFAMASIIYSYYYFKEVRESEVRQLKLEGQLSNMRIKVLNSQLQPHFFFNTLNCISSLVEFNPKKAQKTLVDLSEFFRQVLLTRNHVFVPLEKELKILEYYLNILRVRFSDNLFIEEFIDNDLMGEEVPVLLLQPLIENSIQHGYSYDNPELRIKIQVTSEENYIVLRVENNGTQLGAVDKSIKRRTTQRMGISNIRERLFNIYDDNFEFIVRNIENGPGVENIIKLPKD